MMSSLINMITLPLIATPLSATGSIPWLTLVTFAPLLAAIALMFVPKQQVSILRNGAFIATLGIFALSLPILFKFQTDFPVAQGAFTFQMIEGPIEWIPSLGISYALGVDGFSLWLILLTTFIMPIAVWSTFSAVDKNVKEYMICLLLLETGMLGALVALDVFLFYVFWEMMLIPMYLIIGVWGGEDRINAAVKFFIYTMVGSLLMLIAILYIYFQTDIGGGQHSFLLTDMLSVQVSYKEQMVLFAAFFLAFAIKVPLFPFHTWLPLAHVQAPTAGSVILAAVLLKMGTYGMLRYAFPMFPDALKTFAPYIAILAVIGIVYGALVSLVQDDVKKLVAYSSVSHLGFCVLGLVAMTPQGLQGGMFIMLAHGIATGGLFLCVGILYERRHTKKIKDFGGVAAKMPIFATLFMITVFASVGLPGLNGFVGEFLAIIGTSQSKFLWFDAAHVYTIVEGPNGVNIWDNMDATYWPTPDNQMAGGEMTAYMFAGIAASGVIFAAGYLLWMFRRVMFGPLTNPENEKLHDLNTREILYLVPIVLMAIWMGVFPKYFLRPMEPSVHQFLQHMERNVSVKGTVVVETVNPSWMAKPEQD